MTDDKAEASGDTPRLAGAPVLPATYVSTLPAPPPPPPPPDEPTSEPPERLTSFINAISGPLVTAGDQPPAPGSHWTLRGWHSMRLFGGRALDALPKSTSTLMLVVRLLIVVAAWLLILTIGMMVLFFWAIYVLPFQLYARHRRKKSGVPTEAVATPAPVTPASPAPATDLAALARAPRPDPAPANNSCPMCGGPTTGSTGACLYCTSPLQMVAQKGWYVDPFGANVRRWFDGASWTEHTRRPD